MEKKPLRKRPYNKEILETQALKILLRLGGPKRVCEALAEYNIRIYDPSTIHRWLYPKSRGGTGGVIPPKALDDLLLLAKIEGIILTPEELYQSPKPYVYDDPNNPKKLIPDPEVETQLLIATYAAEKALEAAEALRLDPHGLKRPVGRKSPYTTFIENLPKKPKIDGRY